MKKGSECPESWIPVSVEFPENHEEVKFSVTYLVCTSKKWRKWPDYLVSVGIHTFNKPCSMNQSVLVDYRGLFRGHCPLLNHGSPPIRLFEESFQHTFNQVFVFLTHSDEKQQLNNRSFFRKRNTSSVSETITI